jgi:hypothetical protein
MLSTQSPAVDVVAIGFSDGRIAIHNLKADQTITWFASAYFTGFVFSSFFGCFALPEIS